MAETILRLPAVQSRIGLSRSTIYERIKNGTFPRPIYIGERAIGFIEREIDEWIEARIAESRGQTT